MSQPEMNQSIPPSDSVSRLVAELLHEIAEGLHSMNGYIAAARNQSPATEEISANRLHALIRANDQLARTNNAFRRLRACLAPVFVNIRTDD